MSRRLAIATQTPLLRLGPDPHGSGRHVPAGQAVQLMADGTQVSRLSDFEISPGGVSRMVLQSVQAWRRQGWIQDARWYSLQPAGAERIRLEDAGIELHHLRLAPQELKAYARTKEKLWADIHGLPAPRFDAEDFRFYTRYNCLASDALLAGIHDVDLAYVHDFQLLQVGGLVGLAAPCVLRWHVPFDAQRIPRYTRQFLVRMMENYDGVIVSTRRDLEGLSNAGFHGQVKQIYPHSDRTQWMSSSPMDVQELEDRFKLQGRRVIVVVARMDPIKRQDLAIAAMKALGDRVPKAMLLLVGNGSFSGSKAGLGTSKADLWRAQLEAQAAELGVQDRVTFTGWLPDRLVAASYARADVVVLPSDIEGFGLTPFEAWTHGKPAIVSSGCGSSEVVQNGLSGYVFPAGDAHALADCIARSLGSSDRAERMGEAGRITLLQHTPDRAAFEESAFLEEAIGRFGRDGRDA